MASLYPSEHDSSGPGSAASTPRSAAPAPGMAAPRRSSGDDFSSASGAHVRLMCSFGGRILPRPGDHQLRYVGGETRIVAVSRHAPAAAFLAQLSKLSGQTQFAVKYQLPHEDLDALVSLTSDDDLDNMLDEYDRLSSTARAGQRAPRLRLFLFPLSDPDPSPFGSVLDDAGGNGRHRWFVDALNGGVGGGLERGRSEVSSIVSETPDYLFGLDTNSDEPTPPPTATKHRYSPLAHDNLPVSVPGSPAPDLPPVKTQPDEGHEETGDRLVEPTVHGSTGYVANPVWQYVPEPAPVYYMTGPVHGGSLPSQPVSVPLAYMSVGGGQIPVGYRPPPVHGLGHTVHQGPVYMSNPSFNPPVAAPVYDYTMGAEGRESQTPGGLAGIPGVIPVYQTARVHYSVGESTGTAGSEPRIGRASQ